LIRPRRTFLRSITQASFSASMPSSSTIVPAESDSVTGFAPKSISFSTVYWGDVAGAGNRRDLAAHALAACCQHLLREVDRTVPRRLRADQRAAIRQALAGQDAVEAVGNALVLAEEEADLAAPTPMSPAGTSVSGRCGDRAPS